MGALDLLPAQPAADAGQSPAAASDELALQRNAAAFGQMACDFLAGQFGAERAARFVALLLKPTVPGSPDRILQDRAWSALCRRLMAAVGETEG